MVDNTMIYSELTFDYAGSPSDKGQATINLILQLDKCRLKFQGVEFWERKPPSYQRMKVTVALFNIDPLDQPRHEGEAEELIERELDKVGLDCSVLIVRGTEYLDEQARYEPPMTKAEQLGNV